MPALVRFPCSQTILLGDRIQGLEIDVVEATYTMQREAFALRSNLEIEKLRFRCERRVTWVVWMHKNNPENQISLILKYNALCALTIESAELRIAVFSSNMLGAQNSSHQICAWSHLFIPAADESCTTVGTESNDHPPAAFSDTKSLAVGFRPSP